MKTEYAQAAQQIKKIIKAKFPQTTFSVRSEGYSGGNNVNVSWTNGPTEKEVEAHISQYQEGHYNGMEEVYEYSNTNKEIPQTKFLFCNRKMSEEAQEQIIKEHNEKFSEEAQITNLNEWNSAYQCWNSSLVYRKFSEMSMTGAQQ